MKSKPYLEPFWWTLFGAGGVVSAFFLPALLFLFGLAIPLGWVEAPAYERFYELLQPLPIRGAVGMLITLSLFHWAHRFRFTLYDGLQLQLWRKPIAILCYGTALGLSFWAGYFLLNL
ncbi:fumarate reductase subunit FrdD [Rapidithrix thailandica]|uniref:Fumarate reductase subunit FrdD n=1 Tax=Rapidithrix thailandica TaxID=413964 RepID=A0AAW9S1T7_9BACT